MRWLLRAIIVFLFSFTVGFGSASCASAPPNLSSTARAAWYGTKVIKALDVIRDIAIEANASDPPIISTGDTRVIVEWHQDAIKIVHAAPFNWRESVNLSLDDALKHVSAQTRRQVLPYVELAKVLLKEVQ